jgi:hypothetical protein
MRSIQAAAALAIGAAVLLPAFTATPADADWWNKRGRGSIRGSGDVVTQSRDLEAFDGIRVESVANIHIRIGDIQQVEVEAEDNIIDLVDLEVRRGRLIVSMDEDHNINTDEGIHITNTMPKLRDLDLQGVGSIDAVGLDEDEITIDIGGVGSVELEGSVDKLDLDVGGVGDVDLRDLVAQDARVRHKGVGQVRVHAENDLDIRVSGVGSVRYYGTPKNLTKSEDGLGSISAARR